MNGTLRYEAAEPDSDFNYGMIMTDKIIRFSKSDDGEITYIHLTNEEIIEAKDSIVTLETRLHTKQ